MEKSFRYKIGYLFKQILLLYLFLFQCYTFISNVFNISMFIDL